MLELKPVLQSINLHERDTNIQFFDIGHKYIIKTDPTSKYTSVTTWIHSHFPHFDADDIIKKMMSGKSWKEGHKYWGQTAEQIKQSWNSNKENVAGAGTQMHFNIECFMNNSEINPYYTHKELYTYYNTKIVEKNLDQYNCLEWKYFIEFVKDTPELKPYRTEWTVYHEDIKLAGSIDMIYENPDGSLNIYDWKRSKDITRVNNFNKYAITESISHLPDSNYWHYALQLNTYKKILEEKYNKKVRDLYLVRLHPDTEEKTYELIKIPDLKTEMDDLFNERRKILL